ncbi:MAG: endonuclease MutS2 [Ruminococcus sp.]|jgi:DNA mismatch repair protein MutS2|nr:endonuclease MutS2 [Ruminococcus sp.]
MNKYYQTLELHKILFSLEENCSNEFTKAMARELEPCSDLDKVQFELRKTVEAFDLSSKYGSPSFRDFKDIRGSVSRAAFGSSLSFRELIDIAEMLGQIRALSDYYAQVSDEFQISFSYLFISLTPNKYLEERIKDTFLTDEDVADNASYELMMIRKAITEAGLKIRAVLDKMVKDSEVKDSLQESIVTMRDGRYVLPVKAEYKSKVGGIVHAASATGSTYFIEPAAVAELNNEIRILEAREQAEIERIVADLSAQCADMKETMLSDFISCTELNLYFAKSSLAAKMKAGKPDVTADGKFNLKKARHPLIDPKTVVPVDISLGYDYDTLIVTGPNTGGKTVLLKTAGLLTAMVMCGLMIPASDGSVVSVFDKILVDIGDRQSIEESLSTFSSHMSNVAGIIKEADERSLVLLDELGSGTDPVEGAALAVAIIEHLKKLKAKQIVITHYQELKMYAVETPGVQNASCEFNADTLKPTYKLIIGAPGKSNAFYISKNLGVPDSVINYAETLVSTENRRFEQAVKHLEDARHEQDILNDEIRRLKGNAAEKEKQAELRLAEINRKKDEELERARVAAMRIVESCRMESERLIIELNQIKKQKDKHNFTELAGSYKSRQRQALNAMYDAANPVTAKKSDYKLPRDLRQGDNVEIISTGGNGVLMNSPDKNGVVMVQSGMIKTKINISDLKLLSEDEVAKQRLKETKINKHSPIMNFARTASTELDIHGLTVLEALMELDIFLDQAVLCGLHTVTIIHGRGTGTLRNGVRDHLRHHPQVKSFRPGMYGEGEDGVTIAELK